MPAIGLEYLVMAPVTNYTPGSVPTYGAGMRLGKAISANLTITRNNNPLYGDNVVAEDDNGITAISLEVGMTYLTEEMEEAMGLSKKVEGKNNEWDEQSGSANAIGIGYLRNIVRNGVHFYQTVWNFRGLFAPTGENTQTKGQSIEWQTPTVTGNMQGTEVNATDGSIFRRKARFNMNQRAEAIAWLNAWANIGSLTAITVASAAGSTSGKTALTISGYTLPTGASYVYKSAASDAPAITFGQVPDYTWTPWDGSAQLSITNGHKVTVAAVGENGRAIASGSATVVSA